MRKLTSVLLLAAIVCIQALANPAHRGSVLMPQPDGSMLTVCLEGDEFYHFNTTADGYTIMLNEQGAYVYAKRDGMNLVPTEVLAHDAAQRSADESALLATLSKRLVDETEVAQAHVRRARRSVDLSNFDFENFRGCVILIDFSDKQFASDDPQTFYTEMFSADGFTGYYDPITGRDVTCPGSVHDYFKDQSNGVFQPPFDVYGPYRATYGTTANIEARAAQCQNLASSIFQNVLKKADPDIDYSRYDNNGDGKIDMVYFLVAGYSSSYSGNNSGYLWPHASNLSWTYKSYDGKWIDRYASSTELYGFENTPSTVTVEGIGTVAHEFSHVLGLPDFYDTDYAQGGGQSHDPGGWDVMAGGGDYNYGRCPAGYTFYERYALGWANPTTLVAPGSYSLEAVNKSRSGYILRTPVQNEFFTIENRQKTGWDAYLPGHGMIVTRVDSTDLSVWVNNKVNCNPEHNYFEMLRAGNTTSGDLSSDPFPGTTGNIMLTNDSHPNLATWDGYANELNIINIAESGDGLITFNVIYDGDIPALVEDFESMPVSTGTTDKNVEGAFAVWSFNKSGVRAPGEDKANGENSVMMKLPSLFYSETPVYYNIYMASMTVFNPSATTAKFSLEYAVEKDAEGNPVWITAMSSKGDDAIEAGSKKTTTGYWRLDLKNTQPALFRIYMRAGNKNTATYVDDLTFYYTGEEGGPVEDLTGDVNGDKEVNIADVNTVLAIILGSPADAATMNRADVNNDGEINLADINTLIGIILN
jgi:M6 family metalloprotease-like protein